jgi:nucleotide-binding universal stress UspA family protein
MAGQRHFPQGLKQMTDKPEMKADDPTHRTLLCVVDESEELSQALRFACRRANHTGARMALLYVIAPAEFQHWAAVGDRMKEEAREKAEELINVVASLVQKRTGHIPVVYIREGKAEEELIKLINEHEDISLLILGASAGSEGPGPLVSYLLKEMTGKLRVPVTVVPGILTDEQIDAIS